MQLFGSFVDVKLMKIARPHSENMKREPHRIKSKLKCVFYPHHSCGKAIVRLVSYENKNNVIEA